VSDASDSSHESFAQSLQIAAEVLNEAAHEAAQEQAVATGADSGSGRWPVVPASFFGMVLGLVGIGDCWRAAHLAWGLPTLVSTIIMFIAFAVWAVLVVLYVGKWFWARSDALAEFYHPVQACFVALVPAATMFAGVAIAPQAHSLGVALFAIGAVIQVLYGVYFTGGAWRGNRDLGSATPALYLPTVTTNFISAFVGGYFGFQLLGAVFLGVGLLSWLSLESVVSHRLLFHHTLPLALRPTLGIMLAPPVVGLAGYLFVTGGVDGPVPDLIGWGLLGYGLFQLLLIVRLMPFVAELPFNASYWAFSFGLTALIFDSVIFVVRGATGWITWLSGALFVVGNVVLAVLVIGTLIRLASGKLLPARLSTPNTGP